MPLSAEPAPRGETRHARSAPQGARGLHSGPGLLASWLLLLLVALRIQRAMEAPLLPIGPGASRALSILFLMGWVLGVFGAILSLPPSHGGRTLVTTGPFARVRHPLYAVSLFFLGLLTIASSRSWIVAAAWPISYALAHAWVHVEERGLEEAFGDEWRGYAASTPRFFPRLRRARRPMPVSEPGDPG